MPVYTINRPSLAQKLKKDMRLRTNEDTRNLEVWTHQAGTNFTVWKWWIISPTEYIWYQDELRVRVVGFDPEDNPNENTIKREGVSGQA